MHSLSLAIEITAPDSVKVIDGVEFTGCAFVRMTVDGVDLLNEPAFDGSAMYFAELQRSLTGSGQYLIFTCACGIAEDAGWTEVEVEHCQGKVRWAFEREFCYAFEFDSKRYAMEIEKLRKHIQLVGDEIVLEPQRVVFPFTPEENS